MIYYDSKSFFGVLLRVHNSVLLGTIFHSAVFGILALLGILIAYHVTGPPDKDDTASKALGTTMTVFNTFTGLLMSFRLNSAFTQWREGMVLIDKFALAALSLASRTCAACGAGLPEIQKRNKDKVKSLRQKHIHRSAKLILELRRLLLLYSSLVFKNLRGTIAVEDLLENQLLRPQELEKWKKAGTESSVLEELADLKKQTVVAAIAPRKLRCALVLSWIRRLIELNRAKGIVSDLDANALHGATQNLWGEFHALHSSAHVPIPFSYAQYVKIVLVCNITLYTLNIEPDIGFRTPILVFIYSCIMLTCERIANEIQCPFGTDVNSIDLELRLLRLEDELTCIIRDEFFHLGLDPDSYDSPFRNFPEDLKHSLSLVGINVVPRKSDGNGGGNTPGTEKAHLLGDHEVKSHIPSLSHKPPPRPPPSRSPPPRPLLSSFKVISERGIWALEEGESKSNENPDGTVGSGVFDTVTEPESTSPINFGSYGYHSRIATQKKRSRKEHGEIA